MASTSGLKSDTVKYPGERLTTNGNQLVAYYTEARLADAGIFYPITPSTEQGENFELSFARGELNVFGNAKIAIEAEGEHAAQGGAIAFSVTGRRVVNFTSGQGIVYGLEQYYHAPGKLSTMVIEVAARALTKASLNVHCGHDDIYTALDTGWIMLFGKDAQQAADQALILRKVAELSLTPGMNIQDGFLTSHLERTFLKLEAGLIREFLGRPDDMIPCPTPAQRELFGETRRIVPEMYSLERPLLLGSVQNQEHYMNGVVARRNCFVEPILGFLEDAYREFGDLTGRNYGLVSQYRVEPSDVVFIALGSAAENIEAAVDYIKSRDGVDVGVIHVNVLRPFPEAAIVAALKGKTKVIILERMDDQTAGDGPLARDIRTALSKALENSTSNAHPELPTIRHDEMPQLYSGVYGLGSRDFRPEHVLGAYEFVSHNLKRQDGESAATGKRFFYLGVKHPYAVESDDRPSLLPEGAIAVRFHSIGGWGAITTGKNLSEIMGDLGAFASNRDFPGENREILHVSANPKYGSEKKGAPTNYFLVAAPERIRVNCDLKHVDVVLCCDPKAFTHTNPLLGLKEGGAIIWESNEDDLDRAWLRVPIAARKQIIDKKIRIYILNGFRIARDATSRADLQLRMQGNSFLGAFFKVSSFLADFKIPQEEFLSVVENQYKKKFGKLGQAVVQSNMTVMTEGFAQVRELPHGALDAPDQSTMRGEMITPCTPTGEQGCATGCAPDCSTCASEQLPLTSLTKFDSEFRSGLGYHQPASALASTGSMAAGTGQINSKFVARRLVPRYIPENCTQCMHCITACPDTALPNTAQEIGEVLRTAVANYVHDETARQKLLKIVHDAEPAIRAEMVAEAQKKTGAEPFPAIAVKHIRSQIEQTNGTLVTPGVRQSLVELERILNKIPVAYGCVPQIFGAKEKKVPGSGGVFSIFVSDLCKGCGQCVVECGNHHALEMVEETEEINADLFTGTEFMNRLPDTPKDYLGLYDPDTPIESKAAVLHNHLMQRANYQAIVSGDGACAGCGEKTVLRAIATLTEAYMRPLYHQKADRLRDKAKQLRASGRGRLEKLAAGNPDGYAVFRRTLLHTILGLGGETTSDTDTLIREQFQGGDQELVDALVSVLQQDAYNHSELKTIEGVNAHGMNVMGMTANTGCSTVYGSTPPSNPHPYPWMNSLFQDGTTIGWLIAESFIVKHARSSVIPERLANSILSDFSSSETPLDEQKYFEYTHFTDMMMTDREVSELPKIWAVGGDGGVGDIGYQNLSKTVLQNRPNVQVLMLDTQVYSNTGGQNSDSSVMPGGFDMNQFGSASEGKLTEKKEVAQTMSVGHGSPFVAQVSMANSANLFQAILSGLAYRGTAFFQCFTTCQPEHGVGDSESTVQAQRIRDSRGMIEFVYDPSQGEDQTEAFSLKGNPRLKNDWHVISDKETKEKINYTTAHWAATEARFRQHFRRAPDDYQTTAIPLDYMLTCVTQQDIVNRRVFDPEHISYVPDFGVYAVLQQPDGSMKPSLLSRQLVLFCVERRKNWRLMQSRAGIVNEDYLLQKRLLARCAKGELTRADLLSRTATELDEVAAAP